jgi:DNA-binding transcriptional LysR family regulator
VLTIHQLQVLCVVADEMSIRGASDRLTVSQPAVSASLGALEKEMGVALVARQGRGIELTPAGHTMVRYARSLLALLDEAFERTRSDAGAAPQPMRLGATTGSAAHVLVPLLARLREEKPSLEFTLEVANRARIWRQLADREIDIALSTRPPTTGAFVSLATRPNQFVLVAKPGLVWAGRLSDVTWLIREEGSSTRAAIDEVMTQLDITGPSLVISSNEAIQHSAESGLGVALLPAEAVTDATRRRSLVQVPTEATPLVRPWHLVARAGEPLPTPAQALVAGMAAGEEGFGLTQDGAAFLADR